MSQIKMRRFVNSFDSPDNDQNARKRKRVTLTCTNCKARKVKCDRGAPCSACKRNFIPDHLCIYKDSPFIPTPETVISPEDAVLVLKKENQRLKEELELLKLTRYPVTDGGTVGSFPLPKQYQGVPLASKELKKWESVSLKPDRIVFFGPTCWRTVSDKHNDIQELMQKLMSHASNSRREWKIKRNLKNIPHEEYKDTETAFPSELLKNLVDYLPSYDLIREYLNLYFESYWHQTLAVVNNITLIKDFQTLFIKDETTGKCWITTKSKSIDYAKVALIITIVKIVSLVKNSTSPMSPKYDERDRLSRYCRKLLQFSKMDIKATLPALQTLILSHQVKKLDPLDGDGGDGSNGAMLFKSAMNMAIVMGLHRDIDVLYSKETQSVRSVLKRIWKVLYHQDSQLSLFMGLPLTLEDDSMHPSVFGEDTIRMRLDRLIRQSSRMFTRSSPVSSSEVYSLIKQIENFDNGAVNKISDAIRTLVSPEMIVLRYDLISSIIDRMMAIYTLHVLWETLSDGLPNEDPFKNVCSTAAMKYSVMGITHFIELLYRFNRMCFIASDTGDATTLYKLVDVVSAVIGISKFIFIRAYMTLFTNELRVLPTDRGMELPINANGDQTFKLHITTLEELDPADESSLLARLLRSPAFAQGLMALACKHLLQLQNQSFARVFQFNFCLYGIISCYKFYDNFVEKRIPSDTFTQRRVIQASVRYMKDVESCIVDFSHGSGQTSLTNSPLESAVRNMPFSRTSPDSISDESTIGVGSSSSLLRGAVSSSTTDTSPMTPSMGVSTNTGGGEQVEIQSITPGPITNSNEFSFDFFDFKDDAVERLFDHILSDTSQYNMANFDEQYGFMNYNLNSA